MRARIGFATGYDPAQSVSDFAEAVREVVLGELPALGGEGGVIAIDAGGEIAIEFNSEGMFRASRREGEETQIGIYVST